MEIKNINGYDLKDEIARNEINKITKDRYIIIGDSYSLYRPEVEGIEGWAIPFKRLINANDEDCYIIQNNGGGFTKKGTYGTFLEGISSLNVNDKSSINHIIVAGGLNDINASDKTTIKLAIKNFIDYCKENYPKAKIYMGMIGWNIDDLYTSDNQYTRYRVLEKVLPAYQECCEYGAIYLNGVENVMHDKTEYYDGAHPNQTMCKRLAYYIYQAFKNGYASVTYEDHTLSFSNENIETPYFSIKEKIVNNMTIIFDNNEYGNGVNFLSNYPAVSNFNCYIGNLVSNYISPTYTYDELFTCPCIATDTSNNQYQCVCTAYIKNYNYVYVRFINNTEIEGKQLKEINFLSPYSCKPTIMQ